MLTPGIPLEKVIGVRIPAARKLAKEILSASETEEFLKTLPHQYYDENILHAILISEIKDYDQCMAYTEAFLPFVDNWAVCDIMSPKIFKKNKDNSIVLNRQVMILSLMGKVREAFDFQERAMKHDENDILWIYFKLQSSYAKGENDSARYYAGKGYDLLAAKAAKASKDERGPLLIEQISYAMFLKDKEKINKLAKAIEDETGYQMSADIDQQTEMQFRILNALKKSYETGCPLETPITTAQPEATPDAGKQ